MNRRDVHHVSDQCNLRLIKKVAFPYQYALGAVVCLQTSLLAVPQFEFVRPLLQVPHLSFAGPWLGQPAASRPYRARHSTPLPLWPEAAVRCSAAVRPGIGAITDIADLPRNE
jgi:hypothetical protein